MVSKKQIIDSVWLIVFSITITKAGFWLIYFFINTYPQWSDIIKKTGQGIIVLLILGLGVLPYLAVWGAQAIDKNKPDSVHIVASNNDGDSIGILKILITSVCGVLVLILTKLLFDTGLIGLPVIIVILIAGFLSFGIYSKYRLIIGWGGRLVLHLIMLLAIFITFFYLPHSPYKVV